MDAFTLRTNHTFWFVQGLEVRNFIGEYSFRHHIWLIHCCSNKDRYTWYSPLQDVWTLYVLWYNVFITL